MSHPLRGMIAPASLKLPPLPTLPPTALPTTPGHDCPGLIEARRAAAAKGLGASALRGMIAPASLKPHASRYCVSAASSHSGA